MERRENGPTVFTIQVTLSTRYKQRAEGRAKDCDCRSRALLKMLKHFGIVPRLSTAYQHHQDTHTSRLESTAKVRNRLL